MLKLNWEGVKINYAQAVFTIQHWAPKIFSPVAQALSCQSRSTTHKQIATHGQKSKLYKPEVRLLVHVLKHECPCGDVGWPHTLWADKLGKISHMVRSFIHSVSFHCLRPHDAHQFVFHNSFKITSASELLFMFKHIAQRNLPLVTRNTIPFPSTVNGSDVIKFSLFR